MPAPAADAEPAPMRPPLLFLDDAARSPDPAVCPFFRFELDGDLVAPLHKPDDGNRCAAIGDPRPQSARQQELVCLTSAHADCPRYLRGAMAIKDPEAAARTSAVPRATLAAILVLVLSAGISFGFVVQRGGIELPAGGADPSASAIAVVPPPSDEPQATLVVEPSFEPSEAASVEPSVDAVATPSPADSPSPTAPPTASPSPSPTLAPTPSPTLAPTAPPTVAPTVAPTPKPTPKPTAKPTSDRYKLLTACPDKPNCWIYRVRSGDNLYSIAHYFGVSQSTLYAWNPRYANGAHLRTGDQIRMPPPTR
ncbi:MAG TPA: LysM peptidoglycan-binding domain-containing protein [Candidatus Limnocylindrales bacterium]